MKEAIIYDLDNTIYAVPLIGEQLFASLFRLIAASGQHQSDMDVIKADIMRKPFQMVAAHHQFSHELTQKGINLLNDLTYSGPIKYFSDYAETGLLPGERFLVTTGFRKLQLSKIRGMGIEKDFKEIHIVDPMTSAKTKKDVFADIMERNGYTPAEMLVVGDDPESEIKAARELGIDTALYDKYNLHAQTEATYRISDFKELGKLL
ncbi:HAD family hydrolase [Pontibacter rufus]|uniref:HAD family hydrolase n=1 Tax=Pontibacter rufus TaxID=2791028 RepID=UPI001E460F72|nr:HAD family hydrolase [Pontibacter sp. 172403-2]